MYPERKAIFSALCLAALLSISLADQAFAAPKEIRIGYLVADQLHSPAVMVMKEKKLLEAAGFAVKWRAFLTGTYAMQDLTWGSIDFASCGAIPIITTHARGVKLVILAGANEEGSSLVVDTSIKTLNDLDGKTIGTPGSGSTQDALLLQLAKKHNIQVKRRGMKVADMPLFLQKKNIDGFIAWAPHPARAIEHSIGHELLTSRDMSPGHQCCVLVARESTLQGDPKIVTALLKVYLDAYRWFLDNPEESIQMLVKNTGMSEDILRQAIKTVNYPYPPYCNVASLQRMARSLLATDAIPPMEEDELAPFLKSLYRPELLEEVSGTGRPGP
jgi:NitT/TauT family transport system substrate-binding protein